MYKIPEDIDFKYYLELRLQETNVTELNYLFIALEKTKSYIAGDAALAYINRHEELTDVDVYVVSKYYLTFTSILRNEQKNDIPDIIYTYPEDSDQHHLLRYTFKILSLKINIFIIEDIAESLGHFPLSFLQVYFDGKHMYTTSQDNYDRIKIKVGEASDKADKVLYTAQGYKIIGIPKQKSILREEEFIVKRLVDILFIMDQSLFRLPLTDNYMKVSFLYMLQKNKKAFTIDDFAETLETHVGEEYFLIRHVLNAQIKKDADRMLINYKRRFHKAYLQKLLVFLIRENNKTMYHPSIEEGVRQFLETSTLDENLYNRFERQYEDWGADLSNLSEAKRLTQTYFKLTKEPYIKTQDEDVTPWMDASDKHTDYEILQKYIASVHEDINKFQTKIKYDYYFNKEYEIIHLSHTIEKPDDFSGKIDYDPAAETVDIIMGENSQVQIALDQGLFVFKFGDIYHHFTEEDLQQTLSNTDYWMYECPERDYDYNELYIKLNAPSPFLIPCTYLYSMFNAGMRLFEIIDTGRTLEKTASFKNTPVGITLDLADYVSANHCQSNTDSKVYRLLNDESYENKDLKPLFHNAGRTMKKKKKKRKTKRR